LAVSERDERSGREGKRIAVGLIGTGAWGNLHAAACINNPHTMIAGLVEVRQGVAESFSQRLGIEVPIFSDYRELLAMDSLDAVIIATPNDLHRPISLAAIEAGKHVLCEKPMATSIADAKAMVAAAEKSAVKTMLGYTKRFFRGGRFFYDLIRREDLGRVYHVRGFYFQSWLSNPNTPIVWRLEKERTGTGCLGDLGSHLTNYVQFVMGDTITRVNAMWRTFVTDRSTIADPGKKQTVDVDDAVMYGAEFKNGAMGVFESSRNATGHRDHWRLEIDAEKGSAVYDNDGPCVLLSRRESPNRDGDWTEIPIPDEYGAAGSDTYPVAIQSAWDHFVDCIRSGAMPAPSFADGLKTERVLDAVARSSITGTAVDVQE